MRVATACVRVECPHPGKCVAAWRCFHPMTTIITDEQLLDRIFEIRRQNNIPWRKLMSLALKHAPEEARAALQEIMVNDIQIAALVRDLTT